MLVIVPSQISPRSYERIEERANSGDARIALHADVALADRPLRTVIARTISGTSQTLFLRVPYEQGTQKYDGANGTGGFDTTIRVDAVVPDREGRRVGASEQHGGTSDELRQPRGEDQRIDHVVDPHDPHGAEDRDADHGRVDEARVVAPRRHLTQHPNQPDDHQRVHAEVEEVGDRRERRALLAGDEPDRGEPDDDEDPAAVIGS